MNRKGISMTLGLAVAGVVFLIIAVAVLGGVGGVWSGNIEWANWLQDDSEYQYCVDKVQNWCTANPGGNWEEANPRCADRYEYNSGTCPGGGSSGTSGGSCSGTCLDPGLCTSGTLSGSCPVSGTVCCDT